MRSSTEQLALVRGWDDTLRHAARWRRRPARHARPVGRGQPRSSRVLLLLATWVVAAVDDAGPDELRPRSARATCDDFGFILYRNGARAGAARDGLRRRLHGRLVAARRRRGPQRLVAPGARPRRPARDGVRRRARRCSRSARRPTRSASRPPTWPTRAACRRRCCSLGLSLHAVPELCALFLPLAAWLLASRRRAWNELLAATFVTTAIAVPVHRGRRGGRGVGLAPRTILSEVTARSATRSDMAGVTEVTDTNFQAEVIESDQPVLVDFWAPWCGPCRMVAPIVEEIAGERPELKVVKLNTDENIQTASEYQILAIPTLLLFRNGQVAKRIQGAMPKKRLEAEIEPAAGLGPPRLRGLDSPLGRPQPPRRARLRRRRLRRGGARRRGRPARVGRGPDRRRASTSSRCSSRRSGSGRSTWPLLYALGRRGRFRLWALAALPAARRRHEHRQPRAPGARGAGDRPRLRAVRARLVRPPQVPCRAGTRSRRAG